MPVEPRKALWRRATDVACELGTILEDSGITVAIGATALSIVTSVVLANVDETEFEAVLASFVKAVRSHRASLLTPPTAMMN